MRIISNLAVILATVALSVAPALADPPTSRIIDGSLVSELDYPYVARLSAGGEILCTGTLVAPRFVLTAAHCFFDDRNRREIGDTDVTVRLGGQDFASLRVYISPQYRPRSAACVEGETDAALIELATDANVSAPIDLLETPVPVGSTVILAGFGTQGSGDAGEDGTVPPLGAIRVGTTVVEGLGDSPPQQNPASSYFYWTFDPGESNTARGDSGGPAFLLIDQKLFLAGITCGGDGNSEFGTQSFQTRADLMRAWVQSIAGITPVNTPPAIGALVPVGASLGQAFSYTVPVTGSQPLQVTASGLPPGLSLTGNLISGTPSALGTYFVQLGASNAFGSAPAELAIVVSGFTPSLTVRKVLLQFDYTESAEDFLDVTGKLTVGPKFNPRGKIVLLRIGRFSKEFKLRGNGRSSGGGRSFLDLKGGFRGNSFRNQTVSFDLTLERLPIFGELATLGFPGSEAASEGQEVPLPISLTVNGIESTATVILRFSTRDARWRVAPR